MPRKNNRKQTPKKRVYFKLEAPEANEVLLSGSFNNWETNSRYLKKNKKGVWSASMMLAPGTHEYRFVVDGEWQNDPGAEIVANPHGTSNNLRVVD